MINQQIDTKNTFEEIVEQLERLYEITKPFTTDHEKTVYEVVPSSEGKTHILYTVQFLSRHDEKQFRIYKETVELKQKPDEWLAYQSYLSNLTESIDKQKPGLVALSKLIEKTAGTIQTDIHGRKFIALGGFPATQLYIKETDKRTIGFSYQQNTNHNYHLLLRPQQELTTCTASVKKLTEIIEAEDVKFICERSNELINWARRTLSY